MTTPIEVTPDYRLVFQGAPPGTAALTLRAESLRNITERFIEIHIEMQELMPKYQFLLREKERVAAEIDRYRGELEAMKQSIQQLIDSAKQPTA